MALVLPDPRDLVSHYATAIWLHGGVGGPERGRVAHSRPPPLARFLVLGRVILLSCPPGLSVIAFPFRPALNLKVEKRGRPQHKDPGARHCGRLCPCIVVACFDPRLIHHLCLGATI